MQQYGASYSWAIQFAHTIVDGNYDGSYGETDRGFRMRCKEMSANYQDVEMGHG